MVCRRFCTFRAALSIHIGKRRIEGFTERRHEIREQSWLQDVLLVRAFGVVFPRTLSIQSRSRRFMVLRCLEH